MRMLPPDRETGGRSAESAWLSSRHWLNQFLEIPCGDKGGMAKLVNAADLKSHLPLSTPANFHQRNGFGSACWVLQEWSGSLPVCFVCAGVSA